MHGSLHENNQMLTFWKVGRIEAAGLKADTETTQARTTIAQKYIFWFNSFQLICE